MTRYHVMMVRRLFTIASVLSLLLCLSIGVLWLRSHWASDGVQEESAGSISAVSSWRGTFMFVKVREPRRPAYWYDERKILMSSGPPLDPRAHSLAWLGLGYDRVGPDLFRVFLPHWLFCLVFLIMPAFWFRRWRRDRWLKREGHCRVCGYDLRASEGRCPECGTAIPHSVGAASRNVS